MFMGKRLAPGFIVVFLDFPSQKNGFWVRKIFWWFFGAKILRITDKLISFWV
jgi:hypothetical protein